MSHVRGLRPRGHGSYLARINLNTTRGYDMAQKLRALKKQAALRFLEVEIVVAQPVKHTLHITTMLVNRS